METEETKSGAKWMREEVKEKPPTIFHINQNGACKCV